MEIQANTLQNQLESWQTFIDNLGEEVILLDKHKKVIAANKRAKEHFGYKQIIPFKLKCSEIFKDLCTNCNTCPATKSFEKQSVITQNLTQGFGPTYQLTTQILPNQWNNQEWLLISGKYINEETGSQIGSADKFEGIWILELNKNLQIIKSNQYAYQFTGQTKKMLEQKNTSITDLLTPEFENAFIDFIEKEAQNYKNNTIRLLLRKTNKTYYGGNATYIQQNNKNSESHILKIEPLESPRYGTPEHFENLRLQHFLHIIAEQMAQSDTIEEGYKKIVYSIKEVLNVNLVGFLHFDSTEQMKVEAALLNNQFKKHVELNKLHPHKANNFISLLKKEGILLASNLSNSNLIIKEDLEQAGIKSFFAYPLKHKKRLVGSLILGYPQITVWHQNKIDFIKTISSIILQNLLQYEIKLKLRRINNNFVNIFENSSDAILIVDLNGAIIEINHTAETITGYTKNELLLKNVSDISKTEKLDLTQIPHEMLQSHQMIFGTELIPKKGEPIPVETREKIIRFHDKLSILVIVRDIRHRRKLNQIMVQTISETEDKERKRIAEGLHDDVGPLLSTLRIYIDLLRNEKLSKKEIEDYSQKMNEIINQTISSVREVSRNLMPEVLNDFGLIEAINDFCLKINKTGIIRVNFDTDSNYYNLEDKIRNIIYSIIKELINNSIKHADASEINIKLLQNPKGLHLIFQDNGKGLNLKKQLEKNYPGLGIKNILNKINAISGKVKPIQSKGFGLEMFFPYNTSKKQSTNN